MKERVLVKVLRHSAKSVGLKIDDEGFIDIQELLDHHLFKDLDYEGLMNLVAADAKSRFEVVDNKIRASQGHSLPLEISYPLYSEIALPLFHGTYRIKLKEIQRLGLSRMRRNYIHLTNDLNAVSGIRSNCDVLVYIDVERALNGTLV
jgi:RNA:NAD 2'-phosphotransferase (TPT1/KptA family)